MKEKKDRVDDALNATRAAVEEGIVPGGGVALLRTKKAVDKLKSDNPDVQAGINIVLRALEAPIRQIVENAGVEGSIVVGKVMENKSETYGFDAQEETYKDLVAAGIIDPTKVIRTALQHAASVAGLLVTTEAMVAEHPEEGIADANGRWRRHGWNGRHGLLSQILIPRVVGKAAERRPFCFGNVQRPASPKYGASSRVRAPRLELEVRSGDWSKMPSTRPSKRSSGARPDDAQHASPRGVR